MGERNMTRAYPEAGERRETVETLLSAAAAVAGIGGLADFSALDDAGRSTGWAAWRRPRRRGRGAGAARGGAAAGPARAGRTERVSQRSGRGHPGTPVGVRAGGQCGGGRGEPGAAGGRPPHRPRGGVGLRVPAAHHRAVRGGALLVALRRRGRQPDRGVLPVPGAPPGRRVPDAAYWREQAAHAPDEEPRAVAAFDEKQLLPDEARHNLLVQWHSGLAPTLPTALENVINRLVVEGDDEDFGAIPRPSPTLVADLGRAALH
ncbi:hypothetical protein O1L55_14615 [Streptomyces albulus]|nr:hypothetical protein [Streptomyces noursei]